MAPSDPDNDSSTAEPLQRMVSIDALRGFDMFWILGADVFVAALRNFTASSKSHETTRAFAFHLAEQMDHVPWGGFHFYDLIFPLFVFLMGVSTVFSLDRIVERQGKPAAFWRVFRRGMLLYLLGLFYYGAKSYDDGVEMFRYVGVLQRIAFCYMVGGFLYLSFRWRGLLATSVVILVGYWAAMTFIPVPGLAREDGVSIYAEGKNVANYIDQRFLPGYKWDGQWDPEGLLSNLPAIVSGILGMFAGMILKDPELWPQRRVLYLVLAGIGCLAAGWLWGLQFPIIKKLWTSSFVLYAGGWSFLLVALFHAVIDWGGFEIWARPFVWIGMNPITLYLLAELVNYEKLVGRVIHKPVNPDHQATFQLIASAIAMLIPVGIAYWMHRKRIFLRL